MSMMRFVFLLVALRVTTALAFQSHLRGFTGRTVQNVEYARGLVACPHGVARDTAKTCTETPLHLDIYNPTSDGEKVRPAILIVHGGANAHGDKKELQTVASARFWASQGFVAFCPNYRLASENGTYPGEDFPFHLDRWSRMYPAIRDVKAALRFIRAAASNYSVDTDKIFASGSSAGAMDVLGAAISGPTGFTGELSLQDDPTLQTVHPNLRASVQAVIMHWGNAWALQALSRYHEQQCTASSVSKWHAPGANKSMQDLPLTQADFVKKNPPALIQFHGNLDTVVKYKFAVELDTMYETMGVLHSLRTLNGSGHRAWSHGCQNRSRDLYCPYMDKQALKFISEFL